MNPNDTHVFQTIFDQMETPLLQSVSGLVQGVSSYAQTALPAALVLYIALTGMLIVRGMGVFPASEFIVRAVKLAVVVWFITDATAYSQYVTNFALTQLPSELANAVSTAGNGLSVGAGTFDSVWEPARDAGWRVWEKLSFLNGDFGEMLVIVLYWACALASCVIGFTIWMLSHLILALFIIVGPLVIGLALFSATASMFERWIGALIACVLVQFGIVVLLTLTLQTEAVLVARVTAYSGPNVYAQIQLFFAIIGVFGFSAILAWQMPAWANTLAGGLHFHGAALVLMARAQVARAGQVVGAGARAADRSVTSAAGRIGPAVQSAIRGAPTPARARDLLSR
jgi:type IV secretion system protein VirB6